MLEVKLKGGPNEDLVQGFPGIPATWPRLAGTVEIRTVDPHKPAHEQEATLVSKVFVGLYRTDVVYVPSHRPAISAPRKEQSFLVTRQKEIFRGQPTSCYALDVPFTLSLPTNRAPTATISLQRMLESIYTAFVVLETYCPVSKETTSLTYKFPVRVRRFDTLSFGKYMQPLTGSCTSADHLISLEYRLSSQVYGPGDVISVLLQAVPNIDWPKAKKVKLKRCSIELVQLTKFFVERKHEQSEDGEQENVNMDEGSLMSRNHSVSSISSIDLETVESRIRIAKTDRSFTNAEQDERVGIANGITLNLLVPSVLNSSNDGVLSKEQPAVGYDGRVPFTNSCSLYSIEFKLIFKARFAHARDVQVEDAITVSQFDDSTRAIYMKSLLDHANKVNRIDRRPRKPHVYTEPLDKEVLII